MFEDLLREKDVIKMTREEYESIPYEIHFTKVGDMRRIRNSNEECVMVMKKIENDGEILPRIVIELVKVEIIE